METTQAEVLQQQIARLRRLLRTAIPECWRDICEAEIQRLQPQLDALLKTGRLQGSE